VSVDWDAAHRAMRAWVAAASGLPLPSVYWGEQDAPRPPEPAIELKLFSAHTVGLAWLDTEPAFVQLGPFVVVTATPATATLTIPGHQLTNGDGPLRVASTGELLGGLHPNTGYWVIRLDNDTIQLADSFASSGGADVAREHTAVAISSAGSGTITLSSTPQTVRGGSPVRLVSRSLERVALMLTAYAAEGVGEHAALALLNRLKARQRLPSQQAILRGAHLGLIEVARARTVHGVRNAVMFEPRAITEVYFSAAFEEFEDGQAIERVALTKRLDARRSSISPAVTVPSAGPLPGVR